MCLLLSIATPCLTYSYPCTTPPLKMTSALPSVTCYSTSNHSSNQSTSSSNTQFNPTYPPATFYTLVTPPLYPNLSPPSVPCSSALNNSSNAPKRPSPSKTSPTPPCKCCPPPYSIRLKMFDMSTHYLLFYPTLTRNNPPLATLPTNSPKLFYLYSNSLPSVPPQPSPRASPPYTPPTSPGSFCCC